MMALGWVTNLIQRGRASLDRLYAIFSTHCRSWPKPRDAIPVSGFDHSLTVRERQLCLRYTIGERVLDRIDFCGMENRGQTLGVVGPPGSGKNHPDASA
jgi:ATP-binding cassette subfamily B multidrug efflux pump